MVEKAKKTYNKISEFFSGMDKGKKIRLIIFFVLLVGSLTILSANIGKKNYVVLFSGLELSEAGEVYSRLEEMQIDATTKDGTIFVEESKAESTRMMLAS